jgi:dephospho-CoA kinase
LFLYDLIHCILPFRERQLQVRDQNREEGKMCAKLKLGVTGGIGSGKTTVCRIFEALGIHVFSADTEARVIMDCDKAVMKQVNTLAGRDMYSSGKLDRIAMADLIFNNRELLSKINNIIHPIVISRFIEWERSDDSPYVILEAAILFESGSAKLLDKVLTVTAPEEERIERVVHRNNLTREQVIERMRNQSDDNYKVSLSDYVISNSENDMIIPAVLKIHEEMLILAKN